MRKKYNGNSNYLITFGFAKLVPAIFILLFLLSFEVSTQVLTIGILIIVLLFLSTLFGLRKLVYVDFREEHFVIKHFLSGKTEHILYHKLVGLTIIDGRNTKHNYDIINYKVRSKVKKVQVGRIVNFEDYIEFFTWLKAKNEKIQIEITPSDSLLIKDYRKAFPNN